MLISTRKNLLFIFLLALILQACVSTQSFPAYARAGDTITLAVGSPDGMTKVNTTTRFVSDIDGSIVNLSIRAIIRLRPDQTSKAVLYDPMLDAESAYTGHSQWLTVIVIDLPAGLTVGTGNIEVTSSASYGNLFVGINDNPIAIEILDGVGVRNEFSFGTGFGGTSPGDLSLLEPMKQVVFKYKNIGSAPVKLSAAEIKVNIPVGSVSVQGVRVIADDFYTVNDISQLQMSWSRIGDDFTVNYISAGAGAEMNPRQLRFSVVLTPGKDFLLTPAPSIVSVKAYDINGNAMVMFNNIPDESAFAIGIE